MKLAMKIPYKVSEHMEEYNKITELPISRPYSVMLSPSPSVPVQSEVLRWLSLEFQILTDLQ